MVFMMKLEHLLLITIKNINIKMLKSILQVKMDLDRLLALDLVLEV